MDLSLTEQQELLKHTAADFMDREAPRDTLLELEETDSGYSDELWQKASDIGWLGMLVPEKYGGLGLDCTPFALIFDEISKGFMALTGPFSTHRILPYVVTHISNEE